MVLLLYMKVDLNNLEVLVLHLLFFVSHSRAFELNFVFICKHF